MPCLFLSIITVLDFDVCSLQNTHGLCISSVTSDKSHVVGTLLLVSWEHNGMNRNSFSFINNILVPTQDSNLILNSNPIPILMGGVVEEIIKT